MSKEPLIISWSKPATITNSHWMIHCYSKPSRWRQPSRVMWKPQLSQSLVPLNARTQCKCTRITLNLNLDEALGKEMSGRCLHKLTRVYNVLECQESQPYANQTLFITPLAKLAVVPLLHIIWEHQIVWWHRWTISVGCPLLRTRGAWTLKLVVARQRSLWRSLPPLSLMVIGPKAPMV
jgi:hypothetical protein